MNEERRDRYIKAVWGKHGLRGFLTLAIVAVILVVVLLGALSLMGVDVGGYFNRLLGLEVSSHRNWGVLWSITMT